MGFKPRYQRVTVYWGDASSFDAWAPEDEPIEVAECSTTGYLIERTKTYIRIAGSAAINEMVSNVTIIPCEMVRRIERLGM
jgi:hypothetical protein